MWNPQPWATGNSSPDQVDQLLGTWKFLASVMVCKSNWSRAVASAAPKSAARETGMQRQLLSSVWAPQLDNPPFTCVEANAANNTEGKTRWSLRSFPAQTILWYSSKRLHHQGQLNSAQRTLSLHTRPPNPWGLLTATDRKALCSSVCWNVF